MRTRNSGFTLMEVIGVLAVIAIIAAIATPQIFQAIQDAKITAVVQEANDLKAAVARFYKDTGTWPRHIPSHKDAKYKQLMSNSAGVGGWDGPYLESELENSLNPGRYVDVFVTDHRDWACDLDGDGQRDGKFIVYRVDGVDDATAKEISQMLDKDGDQLKGKTHWRKAGRVKRYKGQNNTILAMCLSRV